MWTIIDNLIWLFTGIFSTHLGYFIYEKYYAKDFSAKTFAQSIAAIFDDMLKLLLQFLDKILPLFIASKTLILFVLVLIILLTAFYFWFRMYTRIKTEATLALKRKEAETMLTEAQKQATEQMEKAKALKGKLEEEYNRKEKAMQKEVAAKLTEYIARIKKLEKERLELKELNGSLMRKLKTT